MTPFDRRNLQDTCWLVGLLLVGFVLILGAIIWLLAEAWLALKNWLQ